MPPACMPELWPQQPQASVDRRDQLLTDSPKHMGHLVSSFSLASCTCTMLLSPTAAAHPVVTPHTACQASEVAAHDADVFETSSTHSPAGLQPLIDAVKLGVLLNLPVQSVVNVLCRQLLRQAPVIGSFHWWLFDKFNEALRISPARLLKSAQRPRFESSSSGEIVMHRLLRLKATKSTKSRRETRRKQDKSSEPDSLQWSLSALGLMPWRFRRGLKRLLKVQKASEVF